MTKDVVYDLINGLECLLVTIASDRVVVPDERYVDKNEVLRRVRTLRKEVIDSEIGILPEPKKDLSQYTIAEVKDICTKHKELQEDNTEICKESCPFYNANLVACPFDYDPKNWVTMYPHMTDGLLGNEEDWHC